MRERPSFKRQEKEDPGEEGRVEENKNGELRDR